MKTLFGGHIFFYKMFGASSNIEIDAFDSPKFPATLYQNMKLFALDGGHVERNGNMIVASPGLRDWFQHWEKL